MLFSVAGPSGVALGQETVHLSTARHTPEAGNSRFLLTCLERAGWRLSV